MVVLQRGIQLVPRGSRRSGGGWGTRAGRSCFRVGSRTSGVRRGRHLLLLLQLPESAEGHGSGARRPWEATLTLLCSVGDGWRSPAGRVPCSLAIIIDSREAWGAASNGLAPDTQAPPRGWGTRFGEPRPQRAVDAGLGKLWGTWALSEVSLVTHGTQDIWA